MSEIKAPERNAPPRQSTEASSLPKRCATASGTSPAPTLGDIFDKTPKSVISKVLLEEKSAVALANAIYEELPTSQTDLDHAFKKYIEERRHARQAAVFAFSTSGALMHGQGMVGDVIRYFGLNWIPNWLIQKGLELVNSYCPQMVFLPHVPIRGTFCRTKTNNPSPRGDFSLNTDTFDMA
ncbi:hypothetical protein BGZ47_003848 [Haplosporangium gracile]|nr:hypothetical protein BGZ47_003848 [Haplosporangium gracile]